VGNINSHRGIQESLKATQQCACPPEQQREAGHFLNRLEVLDFLDNLGSLEFLEFIEKFFKKNKITCTGQDL
jgi:hypothetical protein